MSYTQAYRELIEDRFVVEEFDRLGAFIRGALAGIGHRPLEAALEYGIDGFVGELRPGATAQDSWTLEDIGMDGVEVANQPQLELFGAPPITVVGTVIRDPVPNPDPGADPGA